MEQVALAHQTRTQILELVPSKVEGIFVEQREEEYLVLNPLGPRWSIGDVLTPIFVELCDGKRTIGEIIRILCEKIEGLQANDVEGVARRLIEANFFSEGQEISYSPFTSVSFNLTKSCNLQCSFCYYDSGPEHKVFPKTSLNTQDWLTVAKDIYDVNPKAHIFVMGGEPTLRRDWLKIVEGIDALGLKQNVVTNGMFIDRNTAEQLAKLRNVSIQVSLDSVNEANNDSERGLGHHSKAIKAARLLRDCGVRTVISSTVTAKNSIYIRDMQKFCRDEDFEWNPSIFFQVGDKSKGVKDELSLDKDGMRQILYDGSEPSDILAGQVHPGVQRSSCGVGHGIISVHPDGSVSPCNHLMSKQHEIGNVRTESIAELAWRGKTLYSKLDVSRLPKNGCGGCEVRYLCGGGCKANSFHEFGRLDTPPPDCSFLKRHFKDAMWATLRQNQ